MAASTGRRTGERAMRITDITVRQRDGEFEYDAPTDFWEERLLRPIDI